MFRYRPHNGCGAQLDHRVSRITFVFCLYRSFRYFFQPSISQNVVERQRRPAPPGKMCSKTSVARKRAATPAGGRARTDAPRRLYSGNHRKGRTLACAADTRGTSRRANVAMCSSSGDAGDVNEDPGTCKRARAARAGHRDCSARGQLRSADRPASTAIRKSSLDVVTTAIDQYRTPNFGWQDRPRIDGAENPKLPLRQWPQSG